MPVNGGGGSAQTTQIINDTHSDSSNYKVLEWTGPGELKALTVSATSTYTNIVRLTIDGEVKFWGITKLYSTILAFQSLKLISGLTVIQDGTQIIFDNSVSYNCHPNIPNFKFKNSLKIEYKPSTDNPVDIHVEVFA